MDNLDRNASGAALPDQVQPNGAAEPNLGLSTPTPDVRFVGGVITPSDFNPHDLLTAGRQRRSPGDQPAFSAKEADVEEGSLGPGILPTPLASSPAAQPIRAADFARGIGEHHAGTAAPSPANPASRGPISPEQAFGLGDERLRGDNLQADQQPSAMRGGDFPDSAGRRGNGDDAGHVAVRPSIDESPSIGGDFRILKDAGHVRGGRGGQMTVSEANAKPSSSEDRGFGRVVGIQPKSNPIARAVSSFFGSANGREPKVKE